MDGSERWRRLLPAAVALALLAASCTGGGGQQQPPAEPGEVSGDLTVIMEEVPDTDVVEGMLEDVRADLGIEEVDEL